jgi:hypothetical protein
LQALGIKADNVRVWMPAQKRLEIDRFANDTLAEPYDKLFPEALFGPLKQPSNK